jgi:glycosyltransferase involved in cell wall biosynthesis
VSAKKQLMDEVAVLIPCYNEAKTIKKVVGDFKAALPQATIYVYDNNSTDKTSSLAKKAGAVVRYEYQQGKGNVVRRMLREIDAQCYIMVDGDDTYAAKHASEMVAAILERGVDMVVGDRLSSTYFRQNRRQFHNTGNKVVRSTINFLFKSCQTDVMTGYRGLSYAFAKSFPALSAGFEIETEMTIAAIDKKMNIETVVVDYRNRPAGSHSKLNTFTDGFRVIKTIFFLLKNCRPLLFFTTLAVALGVLGIILVIPILLTFFETGLVPRFPTLILCVFLWLAALQSFFTGLVLDMMRQKNLQDHEILLQSIEYRRKQLLC